MALRHGGGLIGPPIATGVSAVSAAGADPTADSVDDLIEAIERAGGPEEAATTLFGSQAKAPGTSRLKSVAVHDAALALRGAGVRTTEDLRATSSDDALQTMAKRARLSVGGLGPASWRYLLMLAGVDGTKPDIMIRRFVTPAVGAEQTVGAERARAAIEGAAAELGVRTFLLDHTVWRLQSARWAGPVEILTEE